MIDTALRTRLISQSGVTTKVGSAQAARIYVGKVKQNATQPSISIFRIGGTRNYIMTGPSGTVPGNFQIDVFGETAQSALETADAVREALSGFTGTVGTDRIQACYLDGDQFYWEDGPNLYRVTQTWSVWYEE